MLYIGRTIQGIQQPRWNIEETKSIAYNGIEKDVRTGSDPKRRSIKIHIRKIVKELG